MTKKPARTASGHFAPGASGNPLGRRPSTPAARQDSATEPSSTSYPDAAAMMSALPAGALGSLIGPQTSDREHLRERYGTRRDGWQSALTGIGDASRDKRMSHTFRVSRLSYTDIIEMWLGDDIAARAIETVPGECMREGYEIVIADDPTPAGGTSSDPSKTPAPPAPTMDGAYPSGSPIPGQTMTGVTSAPKLPGSAPVPGLPKAAAGDHAALRIALERRVRDLDVNGVVERAMQYERAYGGAAILMYVSDGRTMDQPLDVERVRSLDALQALEPIEIYASSFYSDPKNPKFGEPEFYDLNVISQGYNMGPTGQRSAPPSVHRIHESRLIVLGGIRVSKFQRHNASTLGGRWGESILTRLQDVLRDFQVSWQAAGIIVVDFSQSVMKIENLMALVAKNPKLLADRFAAVELSRSTARAVLMDTKEDFERQSTSVTGLPELLDRLSSRLASAIDMPLTLLMGQSPKGLGNEGESDVRFFYDRIASMQTRKVTPMLEKIIRMIMRSVGARVEPKKWSIQWRPLWQLTDAERGDSMLTMARADSLYLKAGVLHPDEVRNSRFGNGYSYETVLDPTKKAPGPLVPPGHGPPGSTPPGGKPPAGAGQHGVSGYARRNPTKAASPGGESGGGGGAVAPGAGAKSDRRPSRLDAVAAALAALDDDEFDEIIGQILEPVTGPQSE